MPEASATSFQSAMIVDADGNQSTSGAAGPSITGDGADTPRSAVTPSLHAGVDTLPATSISFTHAKYVVPSTSVRPDFPGNQSSVFITILYTHVDRIWAGTFLRALRDDWKDDVLEQDRNKLKDEKAGVIRLLQIVDRGDVGMIQRREHLSFALKPAHT